MCYSTESSLTSWVVAVVVAIALYHRNKRYDRWTAAFIVTFTVIQLLEGILWTTIPDGSKQLNELITKLILIALVMQPLVQSFMGYTYTRQRFLKYFTIIFVLLLGYSLMRIQQHGFRSYKGRGGHLVWESPDEEFLGNKWIVALYLSGLFVPLLYTGIYGIPLIATGLVTMAYSALNTNRKEFGSYWCYTSVVYSFVALLIS